MLTVYYDFKDNFWFFLFLISSFYRTFTALQRVFFRSIDQYTHTSTCTGSVNTTEPPWLYWTSLNYTWHTNSFVGSKGAPNPGEITRILSNKVYVYFFNVFIFLSINLTLLPFGNLTTIYAIYYLYIKNLLPLLSGMDQRNRTVHNTHQK